jgi:pimeloyl-ACP methyl ester carboxylesterase
MKTFVTEDGVTTYDEAGAGDDVLVLLHAFPLDHRLWRRQAEAPPRGWRLLLPDLPGFGGSRVFDKPPSVDEMADRAAALLDHLKVPRAVIGGCSMGGYGALAFARRHADRLRGLILCDTRAEADSPEAKATRDKTIAFVRDNPVSALVEQMLPKLLGETTRRERPEVSAEVTRIGSEQKPEAIIAALEALRDRPDATPALSAIAVPTAVLVGAEDQLTPPAVNRALADRIKGATFAQIDGAGHLSCLEQPEAFNKALGRALARLA